MTQTNEPEVLVCDRGPGFDPEPWRDELHGWLRRIGAGPDADDIVQETFLRALRRPPAGEARPWLYGIALNLLRDQQRARQRAGAARANGAGVFESAVPDPPAQAEAKDHLALAARVLAGLSRRQQDAVTLRFHGHEDYAEIGATLGCSEATARQHVYLALKAVRDALLDHGEQR